MLIIVIGRGQSGTRAISRTLAESGVYMGTVNDSYDKVPPEQIYDAARLFGKNVAQLGPYRWDFRGVAQSPPPEARRLIHFYALDSLEQLAKGHAGWKLPETTLIFPWVAKMYPEARFIHWTRDPRDALRHKHITDRLSEWNIPSRGGSPVEQREESWVYHREIVKATPRPKHILDVRFEDFVTDQERSLKRLEAFLGFPLARIEVDTSRVGYDDPFPIQPQLLERYGY